MRISPLPQPISEPVISERYEDMNSVSSTGLRKKGLQEKENKEKTVELRDEKMEDHRLRSLQLGN